jgi:transposase
MFGLSPATRILLFTGQTDLRKGYDGLAALVVATGENVYTGDLYVFVSRRRTSAKILMWQTGGLIIWQKRLDRGRFKIRQCGPGDRAELDLTQLMMLLDGIDISRVKRPPPWRPTK